MNTPAAGREVAMKAIVQDTYGSADVLELRDIDKPGRKSVRLMVKLIEKGKAKQEGNEA
jgi:hypothetical protein